MILYDIELYYIILYYLYIGEIQYHTNDSSRGK